MPAWCCLRRGALRSWEPALPPRFRPSPKAGPPGPSGSALCFPPAGARSSLQGLWHLEGAWVGTQLIEANSASALSACSRHPWVWPPGASPAWASLPDLATTQPGEGHSPGAERPGLWAGWKRDPGFPLVVGVGEEGLGVTWTPRNTTLVLPPPQGWGSAGQE